ncbi:MAG: hypothetical protein HY619_07625 [Thaumarchaeota archaeon]|nr:hypothetical protein [Nitrososphaerota archaeon]
MPFNRLGLSKDHIMHVDKSQLLSERRDALVMMDLMPAYILRGVELKVDAPIRRGVEEQTTEGSK